MTYQQAFDEARAICHAQGVTMALVHDPVGREDWETEEEAYSYCPEPQRALLFRWGTLVVTFRPLPNDKVEVNPAPAIPRA